MQTPERTKELDDFLDQPIDGLLWDLDLLPEQCDSWWKNLVRETIERLAARDAEWQARVDKLEAALNKIATYPIWVARNGRTNKDSAEMLNIARAAIKGAAHE